MPRHATRRGFTLIEIMATVAIIALLASIVLVSVISARKYTNTQRRISDLKQIQSAIEFYYEDHGYYPNSGSGSTNLSVCTGLSGTTAAANADAVVPNLTPKYIQHVPTDPSTDGNATCCYVYIASANGDDYKVIDENCQTQVDYNSRPDLIDPTRDGGSDACKVEAGGSPWAWALMSNTPNAKCL